MACNKVRLDVVLHNPACARVQAAAPRRCAAVCVHVQKKRLVGRDKRVVAELAVLRVLTIWECVCSTRGDRELPCSRFVVAKFLLMGRSRDSMARFARRNPSASPPPDYAAKA
jgi:G:T-mismatch repair DNA endonuclease (very short patch repair protein)